jgi:hypothetical protein
MAKKTPSTVTELIAQQQQSDIDLPSFIFSVITDWMITTDSLLCAHKAIIKRYKAGELPQLTAAGVKCWKQDLKRIKRIIKIQAEMA